MPGVPIGDPVGYAYRGILEGLSQRQTLALIRSEGGAITDSVFRQAYNDAQAAIGALQDVSDVDLLTIPSPDDFVTWHTGSSEGYAYTFQLNVIDPETGLTLQVPHTVVSPFAITIGDALQQAIDDYTSAEPEGHYSYQLVEPASVDLLQMVPSDGS